MTHFCCLFTHQVFPRLRENKPQITVVDKHFKLISHQRFARVIFLASSHATACYQARANIRTSSAGSLKVEYDDERESWKHNNGNLLLNRKKCFMFSGLRAIWPLKRYEALWTFESDKSHRRHIWWWSCFHRTAWTSCYGKITTNPLHSPFRKHKS